MNFGGDHSAPGHGKISPRCVPEGASDEKNTGSWQYIAAMYSDSANFGKICVLCIRKAPQSAVGEYTARTSCRQGALSPSETLKSCTARKSCHPLMDLALAQGCLPPSASPIPATCQYLSPANTRRSLHPLQPGTSRRWASAAIIRRIACSSAKPRGAADCVILTGRPTTECCAELGLDSRTVSKWAQNLRRRPQARPVLRQRCQKRPSKGRIPLDGTIGAPSGTPIPHTLPLRKNEAAKPGKNFARRVIFTPQTRFRRLSGEICSKRVPRLLLSARFEYVSQSSWHRPANSAYVWAKSRPIGAETPFEKQKCTRMSKSEGMWHSSVPSNAACLATARKTNL